jgi:enterochelin esterase-like enzyme
MILNIDFGIMTKNKSPLISGEEVLFFYKGDAGSVYLTGDYNGWALEDEMERYQESGLWYIKKTFPRCARFDYKYVVDGEWITDPLNGNITPVGPGHNSTLIMPGYSSEYDKIVDSAVPKGTLIRDIVFNSSYMKTKMKYHIYLPPRFKKGIVGRILYVLDGSDYLNYAEINRVLDYLIGNKYMPPTAAVLIDTEERSRDLTLYRPYYDYIISELMPAAENEYICTENGFDRSSVRRAVTGVSWGGLTAIYLAVNKPYPFNAVLSQSGSYWPKKWKLLDIVAKAETPLIDFFIQTGTVQDTEEMNDVMAKLLEKKGYSVDYVKYAETHSWYNWRGHLDEGLKKIFRNQSDLHA